MLGNGNGNVRFYLPFFVESNIVVTTRGVDVCERSDTVQPHAAHTAL